MSLLNEVILMEVFCKQEAPNKCKVYPWLGMAESSWRIQKPKFTFRCSLAI